MRVVGGWGQLKLNRNFYHVLLFLSFVPWIVCNGIDCTLKRSCETLLFCYCCCDEDWVWCHINQCPSAVTPTNVRIDLRWRSIGLAPAVPRGTSTRLHTRGWVPREVLARLAGGTRTGTEEPESSGCGFPFSQKVLI